jgi:hypothetical protein
MSDEEIVETEQPTEPGNETSVEQLDDETIEEVPCVQCQLDKALSALTLTTACQMVKDPAAREGCVSWAESLDPEKIDDFQEIARETVRRAGVGSLNDFAKGLNDMMHSAIIDVIAEKKAAGDQISSEEEKIYKFLTLQRGV